MNYDKCDMNDAATRGLFLGMLAAFTGVVAGLLLGVTAGGVVFCGAFYLALRMVEEK